MQEVFLLFRKGMKNKKGSFFGIFILMLLMSMTLISVVTIRLNYNDRQKTAVKQDGYGDILFWILDNNLSPYHMTANDILKSTRENTVVKKVKSMPYIGTHIRSVNGKKEGESLLIQRMDKSFITYTFFDKDYKKMNQKKLKLKENEVAVPLSYVSTYHCKIGDKLSFGSKDSTPVFTIAAFFEDPYMGSSIMGIKTVLINDVTYEHLKQIAVSNQDTKVALGTVLNVYQKTDHGQKLSDLAFVKKLNQKSQLSGYASFSLSNSESQNFMLILTNIFSGILVAFLFLLLIITVIIMSHSISNSIEMEFKDIGILKAMGVPAKRLQVAFLLQYVVTMLFGCIIGIIPAIPVIAFADQMTKTVINLAVSEKIAWIPCLILELAVLLLLCLFTIFQLRKMKHVKPMQAIRDGNTSVYFKSRLQLPISKRFLSLSMAFRQLISGKKNYIGACGIAAILFSFLILVNGMAQWGGAGGKNINAMFSNFDSDVSINYLNPDVKEAVEKQIDLTAKVKTSFYGTTGYMMVNGVQMYVTALSNPKEYTSVYRGRTCKYDNEILITQYVANEFGIGIGDKITVGRGNQKADYMVSGIYQCANDVGANIAMSLSGWEKLQNKELQGNAQVTTSQISQFTYEYQLKDTGKKSQLILSLKKTYDATQINVQSNVGLGGMSSVSVAIKALSFLIYVIAAVFAMVTIALVSGKIIKKETKDYGIFKSIGYTSFNLRMQIAFRMGITATIGSLLGVGLELLFGKTCVMYLLGFMGVYHYNIQSHMQSKVAIFVMIVIFFILVTYIFTRKVKRVSTKMLMSE